MRFSERESTSFDRFSVLLSIICQDLGFTVRYSEPGSYVAKVDLADSNGLLVTSGSGKGANARLGAIAEALEHYTFIAKRESAVAFSAEYVVQQPPMRLDGAVQSIRKYEESNAIIECMEFKPLDCQGQSLKVPAVLVSYKYMQHAMSYPSHPMAYLSKYFTNSGVALGVGTDESILHGINEVIERDYLSDIYVHLSLGTLPQLTNVTQHWLSSKLKNHSEMTDISRQSTYTMATGKACRSECV